MKYAKKKIDKLVDLLIMNNEIERIYIEAYKNVTDNTLKVFFKERAFERNKFSAVIRNEVEIPNRNLKFLSALNKDFHEIKMNFRNIISLENEHNLLDEVFNLKEASINKYNEVLMEPDLSLKLCKAIVKQRDSIQSTMRILKREMAFVA